jgi:hypothetical protein
MRKAIYQRLSDVVPKITSLLDAAWSVANAGLIPAMFSNPSAPEPKRRTTLWFVTEQIRALAGASGRGEDDFQACVTAAKYLAGNDSETLDMVLKQMSVTERGELPDYEIESYEGVELDMRSAVEELNALAEREDTPEEVRGSLLLSADTIEDFYGAGID